MEFNAEGRISRLRQMGRKTRRAWTESDIRQFKALVGQLSTEQIAVMFNRTNAAIIQKAFDLRISLKVRDMRPGRNVVPPLPESARLDRRDTEPATQGEL
jgi:hypothetical protein